MVRAEPIKKDEFFHGKIQKKFLQPPLGVYRLQHFIHRLFEEELKQGSIRVDVFDPSLEIMTGRLDALFARIRAEGYHIVGFSPIRVLLGEDLYFMNHVFEEVARSPSNGNVVFLAGGNEASLNSATLFETMPWLHFCASGLGEPVFEALIRTSIRSWREHQRIRLSPAMFKHIGGLVYQEEPVQHPLSPQPLQLTENPTAKIDSCAFREYSAYWGANIPYERYWEYNASLGPVGDPTFSGTTIKTVRLFTRNFCPYRCSFCSHQTFGRKVFESAESLTPDQIGRLVLEAVQLKGAEGVYFNDDEMFGHVKNARAILLHLLRMKEDGLIPPDLRFYGQTRIDKVNRTTLQLMKEVGFTFLSYGVESFSDESLKAVDLKKGYEAVQALDSVRTALQVGIPITNINLILLHPTITKRSLITTVETTVALLREALALNVRLSVNPFPLIEAYAGAPINELADKHGWPRIRSFMELNDKRWDYTVSYLPVDPELRRLVYDDSDQAVGGATAVVQDRWLSEFDAIMERLTKHPAWPSTPVSRSIGVNGLVTFMAMYRLLGIDHEQSTVTYDSMERLLWELIERFNPSIEIATSSLCKTLANVVMNWSPSHDRALFRVGNVEVPDLVPGEVARKLWESERAELLFSLHNCTPVQLRQAIHDAVYGGLSFSSSLRRQGIPAFHRDHFIRVLLIHPTGNYDGTPLKTAVPHPGIERVHYSLLRDEGTPHVDSLVFNPNLVGHGGIEVFKGMSGIDVVGFSFIPVTLKNDAPLIDYVAREYPQALIVAGGLNIDRLPFEDLFRNTPFDAFVSGPGETVLPALLACLQPPEHPTTKEHRLKLLSAVVEQKRISNIYLRGGDLHLAASLSCNDLPLKVIAEESLRGGIPYDKPDLIHSQTTYRSTQEAIHGGLVPSDMIGARRLYVKVSDNCKARCIFCSAPFVKTIPEDLNNVIDTIRRNLHHYDSVHFADNDLLFDRSLTEALCRLLIDDADLASIPKVAKSRTDEVDEEILELMKRAGFRTITFGVESFDDGILHRMWKKNTAQNNRRAIETTLKVGLRPGMDMIFFSPWETRQTLLASLEQALAYIERGAYLNLVPEVHVHLGDHLHNSRYPVECEEIRFPSTGQVLRNPRRAMIIRHVDRKVVIDEELEQFRRSVLDRKKEWEQHQRTYGLVQRQSVLALLTSSLSSSPSSFSSSWLWGELMKHGWLTPLAPDSDWALVSAPHLRQPWMTNSASSSSLSILSRALSSDTSTLTRKYVSFSLSSLWFARSVYDQIEAENSIGSTTTAIMKHKIAHLIEQELAAEKVPSIV